MCSSPLDFHTGLKCAADAREGTISRLPIAQFCPHLLQAVQHGFTLPFALSFHRAATHGISEITSRTLGQAAHAGAQLDIQWLCEMWDEMHANISCLCFYRSHYTTITIAWRRIGRSKRRFLFESSQGHSWWLFQPGSLTPKVVRLDPKQMEGGELWMMKSSVVARPPEPT